MLVFLDEASRLDCSHDRFTQVATDLIPATFPPAAIPWMPRLEPSGVRHIIENWVAQLHFT
jgi:hypothetical protein